MATDTRHRSFERNQIVNYPEILLPDRPIAFNRDLVRLGIGVNGALMLSQALYWVRRTKTDDHSFFKTVSDWEEETGLTKEEQMTARKKLVSKGYLKVVKKGIPARNYYYLDRELISLDLIKSLAIPTTSGGQNPPLEVGNPDNTHIQRLHTENTTEITKDIPPIVPPQGDDVRVLSFEKFWSVYPRKEGKKKAKEVWIKTKAFNKEGEILRFVEMAKGTDRWKRGFVPHAATFLNGERWEDDTTAYAEPQSGRPSGAPVVLRVLDDDFSEQLAKLDKERSLN